MLYRLRRRLVLVLLAFSPSDICSGGRSPRLAFSLMAAANCHIPPLSSPPDAMSSASSATSRNTCGSMCRWAASSEFGTCWAAVDVAFGVSAGPCSDMNLRKSKCSLRTAEPDPSSDSTIASNAARYLTNLMVASSLVKIFELLLSCWSLDTIRSGWCLRASCWNRFFTSA